ncbi:MAG TPA: deoxyribonuclease IV [Nitrospirota bacterium]|nr:deoxyribonuclease IV [Nitrospirota bacterium]
MRIGFHVSISGGFSLSVQRAFELGCTCMQIFSRNPRGWMVKPLDKSDILEFKKLREKWDIGPVFVHTNYLINLASPRPDLYEKSIEHFVIDLERTETLEAEYLVTHLGSASGKDSAWMIDRVSNAINMAMKLHPPTAAILLENTAGEKGDIGYTLDQVQEVISRLDDASCVGICYDTCHGFAAGYDIRTQKHVDALARKIDATVGLKRLKGMHLNDCLREFGSHVDRHWHIGEGKIGLDGFKVLLNHPAFNSVPKIMETPKETEEDDIKNMKTVNSLVTRNQRDARVKI